MSEDQLLLEKLGLMQDSSGFRDLHWEGSFVDYLEIVRKDDPRVTRTAFQRLYDMVVSYGSEEYERNRETLVHYNFFDDPFEEGRDAVFGLDKPADGAWSGYSNRPPAATGPKGGSSCCTGR
jgi:serine protein kinase